MESTEEVPDVPIKTFKRTKIVATVGPSTNSYKSVVALIKAGANGIRLNFSHGTTQERIDQIGWIRKASEELGKPVAIIQDLQGPKIRLGDFEGIIEVKKGDLITLGLNVDYERSGEIPVQFDLSKNVGPGEKIYISDGKIKTKVKEVKDGKVIIEVENSGVLTRRKGINLPDTDFGGDIITKKDREDLAFGSTQDIDYVAMSFVQTAEDITNLKKLLAGLSSNARVIAKIETKKAIDNLEDIIQETDAVMIARGDLATETSPESVPIIQRKIIELGKKYAKPSIVATHLLGSMTDMPEPTRAEVSDVATATIVGADAIMLSDETAIGKYPIEAISVMKRVINYTQKNTPEPIMTNFAEVKRTKERAISQAIISLAREMAAVAIVAETKSGDTAIQISADRPFVPLIAVTSSPRAAQQLAIVYGTKSYVRPDGKLQATNLTNWLLDNNVLSKGDVVISASGQHPGMVGTTDTIKLRVL